MSNSKQRLFEMMNKVTGMKLNEEILSHKTDEDPINDNGYDDNIGNTIILNYKSSIIQINNTHTNTSFEFAPMEDNTIDTDWVGIFESLLNSEELYVIKVIDYDGNMVNDLETEDFISKRTIKSTLEELNIEFESTLN